MAVRKLSPDMTYRCLVVDAHDHVITTKRFEAANDRDALDRARLIFSAEPVDGVGMRESDRRADRETALAVDDARNRGPHLSDLAYMGAAVLLIFLAAAGALLSSI